MADHLPKTHVEWIHAADFQVGPLRTQAKKVILTPEGDGKMRVQLGNLPEWGGIQLTQVGTYTVTPVPRGGLANLRLTAGPKEGSNLQCPLTDPHCTWSLSAAGMVVAHDLEPTEWAYKNLAKDNPKLAFGTEEPFHVKVEERCVSLLREESTLFTFPTKTYTPFMAFKNMDIVIEFAAAAAIKAP
jgi:hypothetical protein